jgi:hypothetical protein
MRWCCPPQPPPPPPSSCSQRPSSRRACDSCVCGTFFLLQPWVRVWVLYTSQLGFRYLIAVCLIGKPSGALHHRYAAARPVAPPQPPAASASACTSLRAAPSTRRVHDSSARSWLRRTVALSARNHVAITPLRVRSQPRSSCSSSAAAAAAAARQPPCRALLRRTVMTPMLARVH